MQGYIGGQPDGQGSGGILNFQLFQAAKRSQCDKDCMGGGDTIQNMGKGTVTVCQLEKSPWIGVEGERSWFGNHQNVQTNESTGAWVQYRLALGATNSGCTPRVTEVNIHYDKSK